MEAVDLVDGRPNILLIGDKNEFLLNALERELTDIGHSVRRCEPAVNYVGEANSNSVVYILFCAVYDGMDDLFVYLNDCVNDRGIELCIVGERQDVPDIYNAISPDKIAKLYERPVDNKMLLRDVCELFDIALQKKKRKRILLVDDDPSFLRRTQSMLKGQYRVFVANSGASALMVLAKHKVDLILLDYEMPGLNGPKVYELIKSENELSSIPIMFLTAKNDIASVKSALNLKPEHYIMKSMPADLFICTISDFFAKQDMLAAAGML